MQIPTYILAIKGTQGCLSIAESRRKDFDLPISFDEKYADFLFEFSESRIFCKENDEIVLLKGSFDVSDIAQDHRFVETFKRRVRELEDLTCWTVLRSKIAMSEKSLVYRQRMSQHLTRKQSAFQRLQRRTLKTQDCLTKRLPPCSIEVGIETGINGECAQQSLAL